MHKNCIITIPSESPGDLSATPSPHFAYCEVYSLITIKNSVISHLSTVPTTRNINTLIKAIQTIQSLGSNVLITQGISLKPLAKFQQIGIYVYYSNNLSTISAILTLFLQDKLIPFRLIPFYQKDNS